MNNVCLEVGASVQMKKAHPCGSTGWQVLMVGADVKLKCEGCGHIIMLSRQKLKKSLRNAESACNEA